MSLPDSIEFTFVDTVRIGRAVAHYLDGDDGFEYMAVQAPRDKPKAEIEQGIGPNWSLVEKTLHTVKHEIEGERFVRKFPGPVACYLYRRPRP